MRKSPAMPVFGNFETIRELASDDGRIIYLAQNRQDRTDRRQYAVVVFRVRKATEHYERDDLGIRNLGQDLQLAFLTTVKAQKRASDAGACCPLRRAMHLSVPCSLPGYVAGHANQHKGMEASPHNGRKQS